MTDITKPFERIVAHIPPSLVEKADQLAKDDTRFHVFGKPSRAAVIREALSLFFAPSVAQEQHLESNSDN